MRIFTDEASSTLHPSRSLFACIGVFSGHNGRILVETIGYRRASHGTTSNDIQRMLRRMAGLLVFHCEWLLGMPADYLRPMTKNCLPKNLQTQGRLR